VPKFTAFPNRKYEGAPGSTNVDARFGRITAAFDHFFLADTDRLHYAVRAIEYKAPLADIATSGQAPRQYCGQNRIVRRPFVTFGNSGTIKNAVRSLAAADSTWTSNTAGADAQMYQVEKAGADLYGVTDAGVSAGIGDWHISKCPSGNNPTLAASWGNGLEVGGPEWIITGLAAINGVLYPTHDGKLYFFDGVSTQEVTPEKSWGVVPRDVGISRITAIADNGAQVAVVMEAAQTGTQNAATLIVNRVTVGLDATAITTNLIDGSFATGASPTASSGVHVDVWADVPFEGVIFYVTRVANASSGTINSVNYSSATDTFTSAGGFIDNTKIGTGGGSFSYVGYPTSASYGVVRPKAINMYDLMQKVDFNYASGTDVSQKYGMRFSFTGTIDTATMIDEIEIIPCRAGLPITAIHDFSHIDRAGLTQHIYVADRSRTTDFVWRDAYTVDSFGGTWALCWHNGRLGQSSGQQNTGQSLIGWGRHRTFAINESPTRDPTRTLYPMLVESGTTKPAPVYNITPDGWDGDRPDVEKVITQLRINCRYLQPGDNLKLYMQFNDNDCILVGQSYGAPAHFDLSSQPAFRWCNLWVQIVDNQTTAAKAPEIRHIEWDWEVAGPRGDGQLPQDPAPSVPPAT
jgi:hypothetical protein